MSIQLSLSNRIDKFVTIDQHVYDALMADPRFKEIKFFEKLRAHSNGYAFFQRYEAKNGKQAYETIYLHKLIAELYVEKPRTDRTMFVRFIDGDVLNATIANLEWVTMNTLRRHMKGRSKSTGYRGVTKDRGRFRAVIYYEDKAHDLGFFELADDAALAYNKRSRELFGETNSLNVVLDQDGKPRKK